MKICRCFVLLAAGAFLMLAFVTPGNGQDKPVDESQALIAPALPFNGLDMNLGNLSRLSNAQSRSISPENFTGE
jgi:hypothetical protein